MDWRPYIKAEADIMGGVPCITDTRIPVSVVLDNLAAGLSAPDLISQYP